MHDVVIIGGGPAGMAASVYAARKVLDQVLISPDIGGQAAWAVEVENYLGCPFISGFDLVTRFEEHVRDFGTKRCDDKVTLLERRGQTFYVKTEAGRKYESRAVIVASGRSARNLGVPGEEQFKGRGVTYCATCDAPLYAGEKVVVVGGGNAGLDAAIQLTKFAEHVTIVEELPNLTADRSLQDRIMAIDNAKVMLNTEVKEIRGSKLVEGVTLRNIATGEVLDLPVAGVFVEIGSLPNVGFLPKDVKVNSRGEIMIDCHNRTNVPGIFAAGDVTDIPGKQIIVAAGEGAKALLAASEYIVHNFPDGWSGAAPES